jgi:hypothetical protein
MPAEDSGEKKPNRNKHHWPRRNKIQKGVIGISAFIHAYRDEQKTNRKQDEREDRAKRFIEIATLLFVVLTTVGIFWQARILNSSDEAIHESANAAKDAAKAATLAADTAREALEISQRAILTTDDWDLRLDTFGANLGPQIVFNLINSGPSPAETLQASFRSRIDSKLPDIPDLDALVPYPGFVRPNFRILVIPQKLDPIKQANYDAILAGRYFIWMYGRIIYRDIFGKIFELGYAVKCFLIKDQAGNVTAAKFEIPQVAGYNYLIERKPDH